MNLTALAREILAGCDQLFDELNKETFDEPIWRLRWFSFVALLRAVGHVVEHENRKIRSMGFEQLFNEVNDLWLRDNKDKLIAKQFICDTRNNMLKEFNFKKIGNEPCNFMTESGKTLISERGDYFTGSTVVYVGEGSLRGKSIYTLFNEAKIFWIKYLNAIDALVVPYTKIEEADANEA